MNKVVLSLIFSWCVLGGSSINDTSLPNSNSAKVWVCTGGSSKRYHLTSKCKGLNSCRGDIKEITLEEAEDQGKTPCRICYKK